jgi:hypothetical protein
MSGRDFFQLGPDEVDQGGVGSGSGGLEVEDEDVCVSKKDVSAGGRVGGKRRKRTGGVRRVVLLVGDVSGVVDVNLKSVDGLELSDDGYCYRKGRRGEKRSGERAEKGRENDEDGDGRTRRVWRV